MWELFAVGSERQPNEALQRARGGRVIRGADAQASLRGLVGGGQGGAEASVELTLIWVLNESNRFWGAR